MYIRVTDFSYMAVLLPQLNVCMYMLVCTCVCTCIHTVGTVVCVVIIVSFGEIQVLWSLKLV